MNGELFPDPGAGERIKGMIRREVFRNASGGFAVFRLDTESDGVITVTGPLPPGQEGEVLEAEGEWVIDPRHGRQFNAKTGHVKPPSSKDAVERSREAEARHRSVRSQ